MNDPLVRRTTGDTRARAMSFGLVAAAYDRARPTYPLDAAVWLTGRTPLSVLELGAGTGKLTDQLLALGHDVLATDPSEEMLQHLRFRHPGCRTAVASAESIPVPSRSVDVVVAAQAFHWFDLDRALPEIARVLRPQGQIALVWNERDERIPWVRRLGDIVGRDEHDLDPSDDLVASKLFGYVEETTFRFWQQLRRTELRDLVLSRSRVATMDPMAQERVLRKVDELFDAYDRGPDGLRMPYVTRCYKAVVRPLLARDPVPDGTGHEQQDAGGSADDDPGSTLIDFR